MEVFGKGSTFWGQIDTDISYLHLSLSAGLFVYIDVHARP